MAMNSNDRSRFEQAQQATADRLAKLRGVGVDVSRLAKGVREQIDAEAPEARGPLRLVFPRVLRAVAASLLVAGLVVALLLSSSGGPVLAAPNTLARIHTEVMSNSDRMMQVHTVEEARKALAGQWPKGPGMPEMSGEHVMACCIHAIGRKKMACLAMEVDGVGVTMAVADAADVKAPASAIRTVGGVDYHVQSAEGVNMAMSQQHGRWVCLMGKVPVERLIEVAQSLKF